MIGGAALLAIVALAGIGVSLLMGTHQAPPRLALKSAQTSNPPSGLAGTWTVAPGSVVGYRVREKFINQTEETEAVARTSQVKGKLVVDVNGQSVTVSQIKISADLASLASQDKYANYQVYQRDFFVRTIYLQTDSFPTATFTAGTTRFLLPATGTLQLDIDGKLTVHGVTKNVTAQIEAIDRGDQAEIVGSINTDMRDFGVDPPEISFTKSEPAVTIEFDLKLSRG